MRKLLKQPSSFEELKHFILAIYNKTDVVVKYQDEEGDLVTMTNDEELHDALITAQRFNMLSLKVVIEDKDEMSFLSSKMGSISVQDDIGSFTEIEHIPVEPQAAAKESYPELESINLPQKRETNEQGQKCHKKRMFNANFFKNHICKAIIKTEIEQALGLKRNHAPMWHNVTCDGCGDKPLLGVRYKCAVCPNFDFCEICEATCYHPHPFLKLTDLDHQIKHFQCVIKNRMPQPSWKNFRSFVEMKYKMKFVGNPVTQRDELSQGQELVKIWQVKNSGNQAWPVGSRLVLVEGDLQGESVEVPPAAPGQTVEVAFRIYPLSQTGRFRGVWRLETIDGVKFGDRLYAQAEVKEAQDIEELIEAMIAMGFDRDTARDVLESTQGNMEMALSRVFDQRR